MKAITRDVIPLEPISNLIRRFTKFSTMPQLGSGNEPSKSVGYYHSLKGSAIEAIGHLTGSKTWIEDGKREHDAGEAEYKGGQTKNYAEGIADQVSGKVDTITGTITGDRERRQSGQLQQDKGKMLEEANKS